MKQIQEVAPAASCPVCDGTGWRPVRLSNGDRAVTRCECLRLNPHSIAESSATTSIDRKSAAAGDCDLQGDAR